MLNFGETPVRLEAAIEYSAVHQKDFGRQWLFNLKVIPVVPRPIQKPIFGS